MGATKEILTDCTLCYHSCGCRVTVEDGKAIKIRGLESHPLNRGRLCPKGATALQSIYSPDRLKYPMKRVDGGFRRISWDQALDEIAEKLNSLKDEFGPQVLGTFCGSIGVENLEMSTLVHLLKAAYGSPNFFSLESICYRIRIRTRQLTFGRYPIEEWSSNLYVLWGHNPDQSDFPLKFALKRNLKKRAKLVVIDPKRIPLADRADMYLRIRPGTDGALALAMINVIIAEDLYDRDFVEKHIGRKMIKGGGGNIVNIATTAAITGVPRAPAYSASKAGVILLTKSLALEWARYNVRVNAIAPHYLETDLTKGLMDSEKLYKALIKQIPLRRFGKTSEVIGTVLFLSFNASSYVTGAVIPVDGGYLAQ